MDESRDFEDIGSRPMESDLEPLNGIDAVELDDTETSLQGEGEGTVFSLDQLVEELTAERDEYLKALQLTKADFDNYRRRTQRMEVEASERRVVAMLEKLLPSLDDLSSLYSHKLGTEDEDLVSKTVLPMFAVLGTEGLERIDKVGVGFDPSMHQAVEHQDGEDGPTVAEISRAGYAWKGKTIRPALVKVVG